MTEPGTSEFSSFMEKDQPKEEPEQVTFDFSTSTSEKPKEDQEPAVGASKPDEEKKPV
jgi:hypothetical protein